MHQDADTHVSDSALVLCVTQWRIIGAEIQQALFLLAQFTRRRRLCHSNRSFLLVIVIIIVIIPLRSTSSPPVRHATNDDFTERNREDPFYFSSSGCSLLLYFQSLSPCGVRFFLRSITRLPIDPLYPTCDTKAFCRCSSIIRCSVKVQRRCSVFSGLCKLIVPLLEEKICRLNFVSSLQQRLTRLILFQMMVLHNH